MISISQDLTLKHGNMLSKSEPLIYRNRHGSIFKLIFIQSRPLMVYSLGKSWPIKTECCITCDGNLLSSKAVVKHAYDKNDPVMAHRRAADKLLKSVSDVISRNDRTMLWVSIEKHLNDKF